MIKRTNLIFDYMSIVNDDFETINDSLPNCIYYITLSSFNR